VIQFEKKFSLLLFSLKKKFAMLISELFEQSNPNLKRGKHMSEEITTESDLVRVEIRLTKSELELIKNWAIKHGVEIKSVPNLIYLTLAKGVEFSPRTEKPKNDRGQGRKKKQVPTDLELAEAALLASAKKTESELIEVKKQSAPILKK
jgi:hypothetical protein